LFSGRIKPKGQNRIAKIGYIEQCLREEKLSFNTPVVRGWGLDPERKPKTIYLILGLCMINLPND
jgi:hypothetical protein